MSGKHSNFWISRCQIDQPQALLDPKLAHRRPPAVNLSQVDHLPKVALKQQAHPMFPEEAYGASHHRRHHPCRGADPKIVSGPEETPLDLLPDGPDKVQIGSINRTRGSSNLKVVTLTGTNHLLAIQTTLYGVVVPAVITAGCGDDAAFTPPTNGYLKWYTTL